MYITYLKTEGIVEQMKFHAIALNDNEELVCVVGLPIMTFWKSDT